MEIFCSCKYTLQQVKVRQILDMMYGPICGLKAFREVTLTRGLCQCSFGNCYRENNNKKKPVGCSCVLH